MLSTPRLTTQNNIAAEVAQGIQIPIQTGREQHGHRHVQGSGAAAEGHAADHERQHRDHADHDRERDAGLQPTGERHPADRHAARDTQVQVNDGATTIIGGIFVSREQSTNDRTPCLHRIPLLGWLFKRDTTTDESRELLIFITPRILRG